LGVKSGRVEHAKINLSLIGGLRRGMSPGFSPPAATVAQISKLFVECGDGKIRGDNKDARAFFHCFAQMMLVILASERPCPREEGAGINNWQ